MTLDPGLEKKSVLKNPLLYSSSLVLLVLIYVGWIFVSLWEQSRAVRRKVLEERVELQREADRAAIEQLGGTELGIQYFYASPGTIRRKESAQLCYAVSNAKTVTLDPPAAEVWPSHARCFDVSPTKTTTYALTIAGTSGETKTASVTLKVR